MATYSIHAAKTNLAKLIARAEAGEEIVLTRGRKPVVRIVPFSRSPSGSSDV
ncbi:type II toxin-antitoxin system Phd/YefM family antitoxin [Reyranella sp.]|uniref:type II toxin-antitoxin system Phd/YefM family antitoxin n=1 Tax=Reyranella sp. TaxID=1929291 RepID=UPI0037840594